MLGIVRRKISKHQTNSSQENYSLDKSIRNILGFAEPFLIGTGFVQDSDYIVSPIAIYVENV